MRHPLLGKTAGGGSRLDISQNDTKARPAVHKEV